MAPITPSVFGEHAVPQAASDPLYGLRALYRKDPSDKKIDLGIGVYRDENAKPWVLPVVKLADDMLRSDPDLDHEYLPITGLEDFVTASQKLIFGAKSDALKEGRVSSFQSISGTGAIHLGALFLSKFYTVNGLKAYISSPTWANHEPVFNTVGIAVETYPYFASDTRQLDFGGMLHAINSADDGSIILLHACAHNPTGVDPTHEQWTAIADAMQRKAHLPFFDCAYQGFASGSPENDAWAIRHFVARGFTLLIGQSYAKNFGLYGERVGCFHFVAAPGVDAAAIARRVSSQLSALQRAEISNPPAYGARIVSRVLNDAALHRQWLANLREMSGRIISIRRRLRQALEALGVPGPWHYITDQIGMFTLIDLSPTQIVRLRQEWHIYMMETGRMAMAGLNEGNVEYFASAVAHVVGESSKMGN